MKVSVVIAACVFLGLATSLTAQQPPGTDPALLLRADAQQRANWAAEWLRSEDPFQVAWGAWIARQDHQSALIPLLIGKVQEYHPTEESSSQTVGRDRHDALLVVLDALIGLGASVPVEEARKLYPEFAAQAMILLVRSQEDARPALLDILGIARANWDWLAAGNVLLKTRPPGFAALLLTRFTQHMTVPVVDAMGLGSGGGSGGSECGFSLRAPKARWPVVGLYVLTQFPDRFPRMTATFLAGGETTVYYLRADPGNYDNPPDSPGYCNDGDRDRYRAQYLTKLMEFSSPRVNLDPYPRVRIEWKDDNQYRQELITAVAGQHASFRQAVAWLQESGRVLTPGETAALRHRLEIIVSDDRTNRLAPLPAALENDGNVVVREAFTRPLD